MQTSTMNTPHYLMIYNNIMHVKLCTSQAVIILILCYSFLVLLVIPFIHFPLYFHEYYERSSWLGRTIR